MTLVLLVLETAAIFSHTHITTTYKNTHLPDHAVGRRYVSHADVGRRGMLTERTQY